MSDVSATPPAQDTTSSRKKVAKAPAGQVTPTHGAEHEASPTANGEHSSENSYIRELQKQIRNVNKKLNSTAKTDAIIAENPNSSLDELLASKKINADQKAQAMKKPALHAQLAQIEEQLAQYRKIDKEYQDRIASEKKSAEERFAAELASARSQAKKEAEAQTKAVVKQKLLLFSQFLRAAAAKRVVEEEADTEESKAFEGALLLVYGGDDKAVQAAENIVEGSNDFVPSVEGQALSIKYSQLKELTLEHIPYDGQYDSSEAVATEAAQINADSVSDPTLTHAGLTELGAGQTETLQSAAQGTELPAQMSTDSAGANLAAGRTWDNAGQNTGAEESEDSYVIVPRDISETDIAPAASGQPGSWADDSAEAAANAAAVSATTPVDANDGFREVQGRRGGHRNHRGDGEGRGRGGRGRGGFRGDRGGGERGGRGGFRGERRGGNGEHRGGGGEHRGGRGRGQPRSS